MVYFQSNKLCESELQKWVVVDESGLVNVYTIYMIHCRKNVKGRLLWILLLKVLVNIFSNVSRSLGRVNSEGQYKYDSQEMFKVKVKRQFHQFDPDIQDRIYV